MGGGWRQGKGEDRAFLELFILPYIDPVTPMGFSTNHQPSVRETAASPLSRPEPKRFQAEIFPAFPQDNKLQEALKGLAEEVQEQQGRPCCCVTT